MSKALAINQELDGDLSIGKLSTLCLESRQREPHKQLSNPGRYQKFNYLGTGPGNWIHLITFDT